MTIGCLGSCLLFRVIYFCFDRAANAHARIAPTSSLLHRSSSALSAEQNNQSSLVLEYHLFHHQLFGARSSYFTSRVTSIEVLTSASFKDIHQERLPPKMIGGRLLCDRGVFCMFVFAGGVFSGFCSFLLKIASRVV